MSTVRRFGFVWGLVVGVCAVACRDAAPAPAALSHEAYVWQRAWVPAVGEAVAHPPPRIGALRVLAGEIAPDGAAVWPAVDDRALARSGRPITAVLRIDGSRPIAALSLAPLLSRVDAWRAAGADVRGIEIDHDCATAALADYAAWLARARPPAPLRLSITALPTWTDSPHHLSALTDVVDELVVQVHAVRAPRLFEAREARRGLDAVSAAIGGRAFRVALPTYRVQVGDELLAADPEQLAAFVDELRRRPVPGLRGVVWFRLPVGGDALTWSLATLTAVIDGTRLAPDVHVRLVARAAGAFDIVVENSGTVAAAWPSVRLAGGVTDADLIGGYVADRSGVSWRAPARRLAPGQRAVVGWATGSEVRIDAQ